MGNQSGITHHPSPITVLDDNVEIGAGAKIRHFSHIPCDTRIGENGDVVRNG